MGARGRGAARRGAPSVSLRLTAPPEGEPCRGAQCAPDGRSAQVLPGEKAQALCDYILSISVLEEDRTYMYDLPENSITFRLEDGGSIRVYISDHVIYYDSDYYVSEGYDLLKGLEFLLN